MVVLSDVLNQQLYGGADSVGRTIRIAGRDFRVVGVMRQRTGQDEPVGLRRRAREHRQPDGAVRVRRRAAPGARSLLAAGPARRRLARASPTSPSGVTEYWVRLPPAEARARFAAALAGIDPQLALRSADEIARRFSKAPAPYRVFVILTLVVMEVSVINLMRMLLAKATSRAAEIGIHRALGAGRNTIFGRQLLEGVIVSMVGQRAGAGARRSRRSRCSIG